MNISKFEKVQISSKKYNGLLTVGGAGLPNSQLAPVSLPDGQSVIVNRYGIFPVDAPKATYLLRSHSLERPTERVKSNRTVLGKSKARVVVVESTKIVTESPKIVYAQQGVGLKAAINVTVRQLGPQSAPVTAPTPVIARRRKKVARINGHGIRVLVARATTAQRISK